MSEQKVWGQIKITSKIGYGKQFGFHLPKKLVTEMRLEGGDYFIIIKDSTLPETDIILRHKRHGIEHTYHDLKV